MDMIIHHLPRWFPLGGFALGESVWVLPGRPDLVRHEAIHVEQQRATGKWCFLWRYAVSPTFRVRAEVPAYAAQGFAAAEVPRLLYRWTYLWCFPLGRRGIERIAGEEGAWLH